jgi:energy-coupling factor transporter ATP-binding protein EcfA2
LSGFEIRDPHSLSFGEKQKVNLASVLSYEPDYLVLDEPSSMLDYRSSRDLYRLLRRLNRKGKTIIVIEHDSDFLWNFTDQLLLLNQGELVQSGPSQKILRKTRILNNLGIKIPDYDHLS